MQNGSFTRTNGANLDGAKVWPQFFTDTVIDNAASAREGRAIFRELDFVKIIMPGNQLHVPVFEVNDEHKQRWPEQYKAFRENREPSLEGTPLEEWPILNRAQIAELKYLKIRTIEEMAEISDAVVQRMGMGGRALKEAAKAFLDDGHRMALTQTQAHQIDVLTSENAALKSQVEQLGAQMQQLHTEFMASRNAPSPLATMIPGMHDPAALAEQARAAEPPAASSLDAIAKRKKGRPKKVAA